MLAELCNLSTVKMKTCMALAYTCGFCDELLQAQNVFLLGFILIVESSSSIFGFGNQGIESLILRLDTDRELSNGVDFYVQGFALLFTVAKINLDFLILSL